VLAVYVGDGTRARRLQGQPREGAVGTDRGVGQHGTGMPVGRAVRGVREHPGRGRRRLASSLRRPRDFSSTFLNFLLLLYLSPQPNDPPEIIMFQPSSFTHHVGLLTSMIELTSDLNTGGARL
jgi:hypothetical protein